MSSRELDSELLQVADDGGACVYGEKLALNGDSEGNARQFVPDSTDRAPGLGQESVGTQFETD